MAALPRSSAVVSQRPEGPRSRLQSQVGAGGGGRRVQPAHGGALHARAQAAGKSGFAAGVEANTNLPHVIESRWRPCGVVLFEPSELQGFDRIGCCLCCSRPVHLSLYDTSIRHAGINTWWRTQRMRSWTKLWIYSNVRWAS